MSRSSNGRSSAAANSSFSAAIQRTQLGVAAGVLDRVGGEHVLPLQRAARRSFFAFRTNTSPASATTIPISRATAGSSKYWCADSAITRPSRR